MEAKELRQFTVDDLKGRVKQWKEELFRARFKGQSSETKDTSVFRKLRKDIARANTLITEKSAGIVRETKAPVEAPKKEASAKVEKADKPATKATKAKKVTKGSKG